MKKSIYSRQDVNRELDKVNKKMLINFSLRFPGIKKHILQKWWSCESFISKIFLWKIQKALYRNILWRDMENEQQKYAISFTILLGIRKFPSIKKKRKWNISKSGKQDLGSYAKWTRICNFIFEQEYATFKNVTWTALEFVNFSPRI